MSKKVVLAKNEDAEWIQHIINGKNRYFEMLINKYQHYVFTASYRVLGRREEAEEAAQDTFVKAYRSLAKFDGRSKFSTWLYRIAINTAISYRRKMRFHTGHDELTALRETTPANTDTLKHSEQKKYLQMAMNSLKEDDATLLTLFYLKELRLEEIAEITDIETNTIKVKLHRARKRLAQKMQQLLKEETKTLL